MKVECFILMFVRAELRERARILFFCWFYVLRAANISNIKVRIKATSRRQDCLEIVSRVHFTLYALCKPTVYLKFAASFW